MIDVEADPWRRLTDAAKEINELPDEERNAHWKRVEGALGSAEEPRRRAAAMLLLERERMRLDPESEP